MRFAPAEDITLRTSSLCLCKLSWLTFIFFLLIWLNSINRTESQFRTAHFGELSGFHYLYYFNILDFLIFSTPLSTFLKILLLNDWTICLTKYLFLRLLDSLWMHFSCFLKANKLKACLDH